MSSKKRHAVTTSSVEGKRKRAATTIVTKSSFSPDQPPYVLYKDPSAPTFDEGFESVIKLLRGRKNIAVLIGAGISVSCGIPDFRTEGSGLYSTLDTQDLGLSCPEELFEASFFNEDPRPFYKFARHLYFPRGDDVSVTPSDSHRLLALLDQKKMLRRCYSQNIDGLEEVAGVSTKKIVCAHGSLRYATCCKCKRKVSATELENDIRNGTVAFCQAPCHDNNESSRGKNNNSPTSQQSTHFSNTRISPRKRPRTPSNYNNNAFNMSSSNIANDGSGTTVCGGVMKPNITFFGETLGTNVKRCLETDRNKVDALIVIGTSLSVAPISKVIGYLPANIPRILINRTIVHPKNSTDDESSNNDEPRSEEEKEFRQNYVFDAYLLGFCDDVTRVIGKLLFPTSDFQSKMNTDNKNETSTKGKLLATLRDDDEEFNAADWNATTRVPLERVFLFPGAQTPKKDDKNQGKDFEEPLYREVVYCDGCAEKIIGTVQKCVMCFDYDLCQKCYPSLSKSHYDGTHHFIAEISTCTEMD